MAGIPTPRNGYVPVPNSMQIIGDAIGAGVQGYRLGMQMEDDAATMEMKKERFASDQKNSELDQRIKETQIAIHEHNLTDVQLQSRLAQGNAARRMNQRMLDVYNEEVTKGTDPEAWVNDPKNQAPYQAALKLHFGDKVPPDYPPEWTAQWGMGFEKQMYVTNGALKAELMSKPQRDEKGNEYQFDPTGEKVYSNEPKDTYKSREVKRGGEIVTEESTDGGKTWRNIGTAPRQTPPGPSRESQRIEEMVATGVPQEIASGIVNKTIREISGYDNNGMVMKTLVNVATGQEIGSVINGKWVPAGASPSPSDDPMGLR